MEWSGFDLGWGQVSFRRLPGVNGGLCVWRRLGLNGRNGKGRVYRDLSIEGSIKVLRKC